jgi:hypothetical protein
LRRSSHCVKHAHPSRGAAEAHMRALLRLDMARDPARLHVYLCGRCFEWHVGHAKKSAHVSKYRKAGR